ncbi:CRP/FNR family transcriptional regulator [Paenibacillus rhizosphaerae]|uniref:CRP/FNR family transcriptional regulator n=2 Tax=Paenibacillus TaxID=44249 RepID=A0A839TFX7_9BACL|nr:MULTISPECIES: Crp/Fnr family transcriptional regulator [Paenibacillus]MBB3125454.1 CRP/FNR family transcriptional regulator [Paenibacillus rhizosphaerae]MBJ9987878.1 Crp/Fnr family transcriptional regulator [Paenibacillus sp. S28]
MNKLWYLSQISIFEEMSQEEIREIDQLDTIHHFNWITKNTLVQTPESAREGLYFVKEGKLRLYKLNDSGKQFTLGILTRGNIFGELNSFSFGTRQVYIETLESSLLCTMSELQFERLMINRPQLALKFLKALSDRLKEREDQLEQLALHGLRKRLLHLLSTLSTKFGIIQDGYALIDLPLSHQEIANMLSASREAVSGVMSELAKEGVVKTSRLSVQLAVTILEEHIPQNSTH